jgi:hypothetical protein
VGAAVQEKAAVPGAPARVPVGLAQETGSPAQEMPVVWGRAQWGPEGPKAGWVQASSVWAAASV